MTGLRSLLPTRRVGWLLALLATGVLAALSAGAPQLPLLALPSGVVLAAATRTRPRRWPLIGVAGVGVAAAAYAVTGTPVAESLAVAAIQTVAALAGAGLLRAVRVSRIVTLLDLFVFGCVALMLGMGTAAAVTATQPGQSQAWPFWWLVTSLGVALPAPGLLAGTSWRMPRRRARYLEAAVLLVAAIALTLLAARAADAIVPGRPPYLLLPLLLWIGLRFGLRLVSAISTLVASVLLAGELDAGWEAASRADWPTHLVTVTATVTGLLLIYAVALQEEKRRLGELQLRANQDFVRSLLTNSPALVTVVHYTPEGESAMATVSPTFGQLLARSEEDLVGCSWIDILGPAAGRQAQREDLQVLASGQAQVFVTRLGPRGHRRTLMTTKFPLRSAEGGVRAVGMVALDVTEHRRLDRIMRLTFDLSPVPMARLAVAGPELGPILDANEALGELLGQQPTALRGRDLRRFLHPDERDVAWAPDAANAEGRGTAREMRIVDAEGQTHWVAVTVSVVHGAGARDEDAFALAVMEDVTSRHAAEQTLTYQARHDALTGLPNRYALIERLDASLQRLWGSPAHVAVLFCDLDGFKTLNDTLSHRAGDEVLIGVAERLRGAVRPQDSVARLGGDEFVVIADDVASVKEAMEIGERLCASVRAPFRVKNREVGLSLSVGVALSSDPRTTSQDLLRQADLAMYRAKDGGRNRVEAYVETLEAAAVARMQVQEFLRVALAEGSVHMEYQPIVALDGSGVTAVEALVRIPAPAPVSTQAFIDAAEENGLMGQLSDHVVRLVLTDVAEWERRGVHLRVHLNTSATQLSDPAFPERVFEQLMAAGVGPGQVCFEVGPRHSSDAATALRRVHELGFRVGIDGFGAGGLTSLKELPADYVKIDRSFIQHLATSHEDQVIVQGVIRVAHDLGRRVIATGVEDKAQMRVLRDLYCDEAQGYIHSASVRASRVPELLAEVR